MIANLIVNTVKTKVLKGIVKGKDKVVVVVFSTGPKKYAYFNNGQDLNAGDVITVPTASGNDLEATVVFTTNARRWVSKATREVY